MYNSWYKLPNSYPNKEFYSKVICTCKSNYDIYHINLYCPTGKALVDSDYYIVKPNNCGKYDATTKLLTCITCGSLYYNAFIHPRQYIDVFDITNSGTDIIGHCWHCLELKAKDMGGLKLPPMPELLNPRLEPNEIDADTLLSSLDIFGDL